MLLEVYFYLDRVPGQPVDPKLKEFLRFVLSRQGQDILHAHGLDTVTPTVSGDASKLPAALKMK